MRSLIFFCLLAACSRGQSSSPTTLGSDDADLVFSGMCDASGAVPLDDTHFAVADDEDNVLRVYDAVRGGPPINAVDVSSGLELARSKKKTPSRKAKKAPETDIEDGARVGDLAFWITSHGRNSSGKLKPERFRFFATTAPERGTNLQVVGTPYSRLLDDVLADPRFAPFHLDRASERAPKEEGGLNIEGLTARREGGVFIGLRNPLFEGKALMFALENPEDVVQGRPAALSDPILLDLGGLGVRSLTWWRGKYLIVAGHYSDAETSRLYAWDAKTTPVRLDVDFRRFNPEGFFAPEGRDSILLLSDDGNVVIDGAECKRLKKNPAQKRFRGRWLRVP